MANQKIDDTKPKAAPVATTPIAPAPPKTPPPLMVGETLTEYGVAVLQKNLGEARDAIGRGLRVITDNKLDCGQEVRGQLENAFEAARAAIAGRTQILHLNQAGRSLETLVNVLANHTLRDQRELGVAREAAHDVQTALKQFQPQPPA